MDKLHYEEYRDVLSVINKRTFNVFVKLYEDGPVPVKSVKNVRSVNELIVGGFVQKSYEGGELKFRTTVIGERVFEAVAEIVDGWGNGSRVAYPDNEDVSKV
jgi:hypothetical protein